MAQRLIRLFPAFVICGCFLFQPVTGRGETRLILTGSSTVAPLAAELGRAFEARHPGVQIDVQTGGSSRGIADLRRGLSDIGMVSRALKPGEGDLRPYTIALDGITMILHQENPVAALTPEQIVQIYRGRIKNWKRVGGRDAPITVVNKAEGRSTLELFSAYFRISPQEILADVVIGDNAQGIKTVAGNPDAIGYVSIGAAEYDASHGVPIKLLPLLGVAPSTQSVRSGRFPIIRPLNLVAKAPPKGWAAAFIRFATSSEADPIVKEQYFVPLAK